MSKDLEKHINELQQESEMWKNKYRLTRGTLDEYIEEFDRNRVELRTLKEGIQQLINTPHYTNYDRVRKLKKLIYQTKK
ncbi:hypothetical protein [Robertmurraya massiliosenegalensis]|uniref:hypothetical protein n=1 Tax=Robertmurraya massiliosenegalensis TaxID=1287657 RepID=UPI0002EFCFAE|nr:hypothetical protein [Robertmurraya massiliosenegalensis]